MNELHIGEMIRKTLKDQGRTVTWFAKAVCYEKSNVYKMFKRKSIDLELLMRISEILNHDFLKDCSEMKKFR